MRASVLAVIRIVVSVVVLAQVDAPQGLTVTNGLRHRSCGSAVASVSVLHCVWHLARAGNPNALLALPRRGGAFAKWYSAQWHQIRYELADLGNVAARESIKKRADGQRVRLEHARLARRVRALKVAREKMKKKIALEKLERACVKELAELRRAKAEQDVD